MTKTLRFISLALAAVLILSAPAFAQTTTTQTALLSAVSSTSDTLFRLVSATDFTASTNTATSFAYVEQELVQIRSVDTTNNTITVVRGIGGTASTHAVGAVVTEGVIGTINRATGDSSGVFFQQDPIGSCTTANQGYTLVVNVNTHQYFRCNADTGEWDDANYRFNRVNVSDANDAAYTATLLDRYVVILPTAARTITLPSITGIDGFQLTVMHLDTGAQTITVRGVNGQHIGGAANGGPGAITNTEINAHDESITFVSYNNRWFTTR